MGKNSKRKFSETDVSLATTDVKKQHFGNNDGSIISNIKPPNATRPEGSLSQKPKVSSSEWNFTVDYNDHFETPKIAYTDLLPVLRSLADKLGKTLEQLIIYDPYWCKGNMVGCLAELGLTNVINRNRDFYKDIKNNQVPGLSAQWRP